MTGPLPAAPVGVGRADVILFGETHKPYTTTVDDVTFVDNGSIGKDRA